MSSLYIPEADDRTVYLNGPQMRAIAIDAPSQMHVWGRRTGKTEGPGGAFTVRRVHDMPRANGLIIGTTYEQLLTRTIPPLVAAWEKLGYYQNVHYWVRKAPPKELEIPKAYRTPLKHDNYIQWYNGSGMYLVSQDRPGSINGVASQWCYGDEAKFLDVHRLREEALITLSGLREHFGDHPHYLATCFMSDMPTSNKGSWMFESEPMMELDACNLVFDLVMEESRMEQLLPTLTSAKQRTTQAELRKLRGYIAQLRTGLVHYSEASTLDNLDVLGIEPIKRFRRDLPDAVFQSSVMNKRVVQVENGFYASLDEDVHGYDKFDYNHIDRLDMSYAGDVAKDCRWDGDIDPNRPLDIGMDYNNIFSCICVGQAHGREYRMVNSLFVDHPLLLTDLVRKFCTYYKHHKTKHVEYFLDHTAIAVNAGSNFSFADIVCNELRAQGWTVKRTYYGQAPKHYTRYLMWGKMLREQDKNLPRFRYNRTNAYQWQVSAQGAGTKRSGDEWKKDKDSEKTVRGQPVMPPRNATHLSEAGDMLLWGAAHRKAGGSNRSFVDTVMG